MIITNTEMFSNKFIQSLCSNINKMIRYLIKQKQGNKVIDIVKFVDGLNLQIINKQTKIVIEMKQQNLSQSTAKDLDQIIKEDSEVEFLKVNRYEVEQNAIFIDYDPEHLKTTIQDYPHLKYYHRLSLSKNIQAIDDICQDKSILYSLMLEIAKDHEDIQKQLIDFYKTTFILHQKPKRTDYREYLLNPLMILIKGMHLEIKQEANRILTSLKDWLSSEQKKEIIKTAIQMSHNNDQQNKIVSIQLIAKMTPDLSHLENQKFFIQQYTKLYNQSSVRVKKQIITELIVLGQNVTPEFFQKEMLENFYLQKCLEKVWGVRKACVEIISQLVKLTTNKKQALANALLSFTKDGNKIVKVSAFKVIPEFLANYESKTMPDKLMEIYLKLMDHEINNLVSRQNQILNKISFFFPGVLYRAGKKSWEDMRKLFERLIHHRNEQVKKPIASSLHEISSIIGPELAKEHMFTALDTILKDKSDNLKLDAINHLSDFVKLFDTVTRENLIDVFLVLQKDPKKWRVRYSIAHQLQDLSKIYQTQTVFKYIFPITLKLCNDNVSQVRSQAAKQMYFVIQSLKSIEIYEQMAIESVKGFGVSEKFIQRQTFAMMVENLCKLRQFEKSFREVLLQLSKDPVIVVRIALAISLSKAIQQTPEIKQRFKQIIAELHTNEEVSEYLQEDTS